MDYNRTQEHVELVFDDGSKLTSKKLEAFLLYEIFAVSAELLKLEMARLQTKGDKPNA